MEATERKASASLEVIARGVDPMMQSIGVAAHSRRQAGAGENLRGWHDLRTRGQLLVRAPCEALRPQPQACVSVRRQDVSEYCLTHIHDQKQQHSSPLQLLADLHYEIVVC